MPSARLGTALTQTWQATAVVYSSGYYTLLTAARHTVVTDQCGQSLVSTITVTTLSVINPHRQHCNHWQMWAIQKHVLTRPLGPHNSWLIAAPWRQILPVVSVSDLLPAISWTYHDITADFSVAGSRAWNHLPDHLCNPSLISGCFRSAL